MVNLNKQAAHCFNEESVGNLMVNTKPLIDQKLKHKQILKLSRLICYF